MEQLEVISILISLGTLVGILWAFKDRIFHSGSRKQRLEDRVSHLEEKDIILTKHITETKDDIKKIKENHLSHIQQDIGDLKVSVGKIETTLEFIKNK